MDFSGCLNDDSLGPAVERCRGDFDFTIKFEKIFLSIIAASVFIAVSLPRVVHLIQQPVIVGGTLLRVGKLTTIATYATLQLALLILSCTEVNKFEAFLISSSALTFASAICMAILSSLEHSRSLRPSILIDSYLFLTILFDVAQTRSLWLASTNFIETSYSRLFTVAVAVKTLLTLLESKDKTRWVSRWDVQEHSPEETTGIYGLGVFFWLNQLFLAGFRNVLLLDDLLPLDQNMASELLKPKLFAGLDATSFHGQRLGLVKAVTKALAVPLLLPLAPRVALTAFQFCQLFLINTLLEYLQQPALDSSRNVAYELIGATLLIYLGIAISTALYWYFQERATYMTRGVLGTAIYRKTTESALSRAYEKAELTLMSADVERIIRGCLNIHEFWANTIQVALASWLLSRELGLAFAAPLVVALLCAATTSLLASYAMPKQKVWMAKLQKRVSLTSSIIDQMKHVKISGLSGPVDDSVQQIRVDELRAGNIFRRILVVSVMVSYLPLCLSPVLAFALAGRTLDITTIFTSISYIFLLATPLSVLFQTIPSLLAAFTCFGRIQAFFEQDSRLDFRQAKVASMFNHDDGSGCDTGLGARGTNDFNTTTATMKIYAGSFGWQPDKLHLSQIDADILTSRLTPSPPESQHCARLSLARSRTLEARLR